MLHTLKRGDWDRTVWCAPGVLSILTGKPVRETHAILGRHIKKTAEDVTGVPTAAIKLALYEEGFLLREVALHARYHEPPTLKKFMRDRSPAERSSLMLVFTASHVGACHLSYYCDNHTRTIAHEEARFSGAYRRVEQVYTLHRIPRTEV